MSHHVHGEVTQGDQGNLVKDPVCGMDVDPNSTAYHAEHDGHTHHFCSEHCRAKFQAEADIAQAQRDFAIRQAQYQAEIETQKARAEQAGPLSEASARQAVG